MPYNSNSDLPKPVRDALPDAAQTVFRRVFNQNIDEKGEASANAIAWTAVKNGWQKQGDSWVAKIEKAEYQGREVTLDKPFRTPGESKKFAVYVKDGDSVKIVRFGDPDMEIRRDDPEARASFRARHNCDAATDKTTPKYWSCRIWDSESVSELTKFAIEGEILKADDEQRMVYGWASVITKNGEPVVDIQGDVIKAEELVSATTEFMKSVRTAKQMHVGAKIGTVVHSLPLTNEIAKSLGIKTDNEGWIVGMHVEDDAVWKAVKDGSLSAFSIGGSGVRKEID